MQRAIGSWQSQAGVCGASPTCLRKGMHEVMELGTMLRPFCIFSACSAAFVPQDVIERSSVWLVRSNQPLSCCTKCLVESPARGG